MLSAGFGLYCVIWMVMVVRPIETEVAIAPSTHSDSPKVASHKSPRSMPNATEREISKLCSARQGVIQKSSSPAASWSGLWQGPLKDAVSGGGLRLDWGCHIVATSAIDGLRCSTREEGGRHFNILPIHHLGKKQHEFRQGEHLKLQHLRHGLSERSGVVLNIDHECHVQVIVDSDRYLSSPHRREL